MKINLNDNWIIECQNKTTGEIKKMGEVDLPKTVNAALNLRPEDEHCFSDEIWTYQKEIESPFENNLIHLNGLISVCEIYIDGELFLKTDNMFKTYTLKVNKNKFLLRLVFVSFEKFIANKKNRARWKTALSIDNSLRYLRTSLIGHIRPWTINSIPFGVSGDMFLTCAFEKNKIEKFSIKKNENSFVIEFVSYLSDLKLFLNNKIYHLERNENNFRCLLTDIEYWQVHTHGNPKLYHLEIFNGDQVILKKNVGFKVVDFNIESGLYLNGKKIFCRGLVHTPINPITLRNTDIDLKKYFELIVAAGINTLRLSGVHIYEDDLFYEYCDRYGILVWQDFMLSNMDYPLNDSEFKKNLLDEIHFQLERLSTFVSITFICGGNEIYQQAAMLGVSETFWKQDFYENELRLITKTYLDQSIYIPNSPSGGDMPFHVGQGIAHYYAIGAYKKSLDFIQMSAVKFASESNGFSHLECEDVCLKNFTENGIKKRTLNWVDGVAKDHLSDWDFEDIRDFYLNKLFSVNASDLRENKFDEYLKLSQVVPGEVIKNNFDFWRSDASGCNGAILWFSKDFKKGAGFGIFDSNLIPKSTYYYLKRLFATEQISLVDLGTDGLKITINNELRKLHQIKVCVDVIAKGRTKVFYSSIEMNLKEIDSWSINSDKLLGSFFDLTYTYKFGPPKHEMVHIYLLDDHEQMICDTFYFPNLSNITQTNLENLKYYIERNGDFVKIIFNTVEFIQNLTLINSDIIFSDNYFHISPFFPKVVLAKTNRRLHVKLTSLNSKQVITINE